jgi:hypothetical protein
MSVGRRGAAEDHVAAVPQRHVVRDCRDVLGHRHALAGERGFRRLEARRLEEPRVGRDGVALLDEEAVTGDELRRRHLAALPVADDGGVGRRHRAQRGHRGLGPRFLDVAHDRVEEDDRADRHRFVGQGGVAFDHPQARRDGSGDEQQDDEDVLELGEKAAPRRNRRRGRELVAPVALEAGARLGLGQAGGVAGIELREQLVQRQAIRGRAGRWSCH